jgi:hypothetical protein
MTAKRYTAEIGGHSWARGPKAQFNTLAECREWAEEYGTTADWCSVEDAKGRPVVAYWRYRNSTEWFRAENRTTHI